MALSIYMSSRIDEEDTNKKQKKIQYWKRFGLKMDDIKLQDAEYESLNYCFESKALR